MRRRKHKRVKSNLSSKIWKIGVGVLILFLILDSYLLVTSRIFNIKSLEVVLDKVSCVDENSIRNEASFLGENFFLLDNRGFEEQMKVKYFCIQSVKLLKTFPDKAKIEVFGREAVAVLAQLTSESTLSGALENLASSSSSTLAQEKIESEFLVDRDGVVFLKDRLDNLPVIYFLGGALNTGNSVGEGLIKSSLKILEKLKSFEVEIKDAKIYSQNILLIIPDTQKPRIIFAMDKNIEVQLASLQLILTQAKIDMQEMEFIDLRYDKPIVKYVPGKNE